MSVRVDRHFTPADLDRIEASVAEVEQQSDGEIAVVLASHSRHWFLDPLLCASVMGLVGLLAILYGTRDQAWGVYYNYTLAALTGVVCFALTWIALAVPPLRPALASWAVRKKALKSFNRLQPTRAQTGVLIFVSLAEREAAVIADVAVAQKVARGYWYKPYQSVVKGIKADRCTDGVIEAIREIGLPLTSHFPRSPDDENELPNRPVME